MDPKELYKGGPTHDELLSGGARVELEVIDRAAGKFVMTGFLVRLLAVKQYAEFRAALGDETKMAALYLGRGHGDQVPELTPASHDLLMDVGRRVNAHFFASWLPRQRELEEVTRNPMSDELLAAAAREFVAAYKQQQDPKPEASEPTAPTAPPVGATHWPPLPA